jgi:hypothetical protein
LTDTVEVLRETSLALETKGWEDIYEFLKKVNNK